MQQNSLGQWAVIDIETTGVDAHYDEIIDIGYYQFEGTQLVKSYSSLIKPKQKISGFIKKLTGITAGQLKNAPSLEKILPEILDLHSHRLMAHNAEFERGFLEKFFSDDCENIHDYSDREEFVDSLPYLALCMPWRSRLSLEALLIDLHLAESEAHRGLSDSADLLKVALLVTWMTKQNQEWGLQVGVALGQHLPEDWWTQFFHLSFEQLKEIGQAIDFDPEEAYRHYQAEEKRKEEQQMRPLPFEPPHRFEGQAISELLKNESGIQKLYPQYLYRESQEELSLRVGQSFKNKVHAMIQAPTGTGKTLGYLVPAGLFSHYEKEQVLVATGTKALQEQAMSKDIPQMKELLGLENLKVARLVGSQNHLCELMYRRTQEEDLFSSQKTWEERFTSAYFDLVFAHNQKTLYADQLTRENLAYSIKRQSDYLRKREQEIAVDFKACTGAKCPYVNSCSYMRGLRVAKEANMIIGNHALLFTWPRGVERPKNIIIDEAHRIEGEATSSFTRVIDSEQLHSLQKSLENSQALGSLYYLLSHHSEEDENPQDLINEMRQEAQKISQSLAAHLFKFNPLLEEYFKSKGRYTSLYWNEKPFIREDGAYDEQAVAIYNQLNDMKYILTGLYEICLPYVEKWTAQSFEEDADLTAYLRFTTFASGLIDLYETLNMLLGGSSGKCLSMKYHEEYGFRFEVAPIDIGKEINDHLFTPSDSVVLTSATLGKTLGQPGSSGMEWACGYSLVAPERRFRSPFFLPSPFEYQNNARVFICDDTVKFYEPHYVENVLTELIPLLLKLGGRSLLLFSARTRFETAREILIDKLEGKLPLFIQGMGHQVVEEFKKAQGGILLGMEAFGEGIDIPGDQLQFLFIDKIPDLRQDLVITERREFYNRHFGNEFQDYFLAHRARSLHQKLGRLLRTVHDRGAAIIVDARLKTWKGKTRTDFFNLLAPYKIERKELSHACQEVEKFLEVSENGDVVFS